MNLMKNYKKPTPWTWRKVGDSLLAVASLFGAGGLIAFDQLKQIYTDHELKVMIGSALLVGIIGKFLTNFFTDEKDK
jgi:hypothetical protein